MKCMQTLIYAHRGSSKAYAENTRAAYMQALADGADGIECDIHLSADGFIVCHHDPTVDRTSDSSGSVGERTLAQLKSLDFSSWKNPQIPPEFGDLHDQLITLRELVELMAESGREIGLAIEIKHPSPFGRKLEDAMLQELKLLGWDPQKSRIENIYVSFMSFDPGSVRYLLEQIPGRHVCQLVTEVDEEWIDELMRAGQADRAAVAAVLAQSMAGGVELLNSGIPHLAGPGIEYIRKHPQTISTWLRNGSTFRVWTVDDPKDAKYLVELGVTQLTSNVPAVIKAELGLA